MTEPDLDAWLASPTIRTRHSREAPVSAARLWDAAGALELAQTPRIGRLVQWRLPGTRPQLTFRDLLAQYPFTVLEEGEHHSISGMCGRIWTLSRDYPRLHGVDEFREWDTPGTVRVLFAHWVRAAPGGGSTLFSEARVAPMDRRAELALRSLWLVVGVFERLIGAEVLERTVRLTRTPDL